MTDIVDQKLGTVGEVKLSIESGAVIFSVGAKVTIDQMLTALEDAIPGDLDNKIIDGLKVILAKV